MERLWLTPFYVYQVSYFTDLSLFSTILLIIWVKTEKIGLFILFIGINLYFWHSYTLCSGV